VAGPRTGPCEPWATADDLRCLNDDGEMPGTCVGSTPVDEEEIARAIDVAGYVLWALSGRQFGVCSITVRPCRRTCLGQNPWPQWGDYSWGATFVTPILSGGQWFNVHCGCQTECSCTEVCEVRLPGPVSAVTAVKVDGVVLPGEPAPLDPEEEPPEEEPPPAAYRVDDWRTLVRLDGECWPLCQDMDLPDTEVGTWSVTVSRGLAPPSAGVEATAELACELLKGWVGESCRLPQRLTSITRQGLSQALFDPMEFLSEGRTGLFLVDLFLMASNPARLAARPTVWSPDRPAKPRVAGT
jgi:hypothetical protein